MNQNLTTDLTADVIARAITDHELEGLADYLSTAPAHRIVATAERLTRRELAVVYRLLPKDTAVRVFESLDPAVQSELVTSLQDAEVNALFAELDPDDRVRLLDELPASIAPRLLRGLSAREREMTATILGYPQDAIGRRMSPEFVSTRQAATVGETLDRVRSRLDDAETVYTLPVTDDERVVVGVVSLRELLGAPTGAVIGDIMSPAATVTAETDAEVAARRCADVGALAVPVVDSENRLVGILTIDDAVRILEHEESEDVARQGGVEPLHRPYLRTSIFTLVRSRVVWLLVLAVGATLTVQVLSHFEAQIDEVTVLALFVPLLIGTGGNTGNQAATTVTRALALGDVGPSDVARVLGRELRVGLLLGLTLGAIGFAVASVFFDPHLGLVIGLTLAAVCTLAATVGGIMPLVAKLVHVDPAVFSNPFISTFLDASGLIVYFLIATAVLGL